MGDLRHPVSSLLPRCRIPVRFPSSQTNFSPYIPLSAPHQGVIRLGGMAPRPGPRFHPTHQGPGLSRPRQQPRLPTQGHTHHTGQPLHPSDHELPDYPCWTHTGIHIPVSRCSTHPTSNLNSSHCLSAPKDHCPRTNGNLEAPSARASSCNTARAPRNSACHQEKSRPEGGPG